jgi:hypothetical protein
MAAKRTWADFDAAVDRYSKTAVGGALVVLPVAVGSAVGVPSGVLLGYLCLVVVVLAVVVVRGRR